MRGDLYISLDSNPSLSFEFLYSRIQIRANSNSRHTAGTALITSNLLKSVLLGTDGMASCGHLLGSKLMTGHLQGKVPDHEGCSGLAMY